MAGCGFAHLKDFEPQLNKVQNVTIDNPGRNRAEKFGVCA